MYIIPISSTITPLNILSQNEAAPKPDNSARPSFTDVFAEVVGDVQETQRVLDQNAADIVMGNIDDLHTVYNNITKAELSLSTLVAIRDAAQSGYRDIMQISL